MTPRERVLKAVNRQKPDKVPRDISWGFSPAVMETFKEKTGCDDPSSYFGVEVRFASLEIAPEKQDEAQAAHCRTAFARYFPALPEDAFVTEWGTAHLAGSVHHFTRIVPPMRQCSSIAQLEAYPFPAFEEEWRRSLVAASIRGWHEQDLAVCGSMATTIFEVAWQLRGMEELFLDFKLNPQFASYLLDRITEIRCSMARFFAANDVDVLILGDDVSMQTGMMMSPGTWRRWFKGRMARIIGEARAIRPNLPIFYHSDGDPEAIIPELIEIGVTILNPVQPECIDPVMVKQRYGDHLALWGTIGTQTTLPFGTPGDVRREVKTRIETVGRGGGLVLGPTHMLEPDVPWENIVALYQAIEDYGAYD